MTLSTTTSRVQYPGAGSVGPFAIPFRFTAGTDLLVTKRSSAGVETTLTHGTHFTVTGAQNATGTLTLVSALAVGETLTIRRAPALTQATSIRNQGSYFPATIEDEFDHLVMQMQKLQDQLDRSFGVKETYDPASLTLRVKPETGKVLGWSSSSELTNMTLDASAVALPGNGRTVSTLSAYLSNNAVFNPKDYGATGDGVTDDRAAIVACDLAAVAAGGAAVVFYRGTYLVLTDLTFTSPVVMLPGAILKSGASTTEIVFGAALGFQAHLHKCFEFTLGTAWATATAYVVDDIRSRNGLNYRCISNHNSDAATEPGLGADWADRWAVHPPIRFSDGSVDAVRPEWWGGKADAAADNRVAFWLAIESVGQAGFPNQNGVMQLTNGRYDIDFTNGAIHIPQNTWVRGVAQTRYGGTRINYEGTGLLGFFFPGGGNGGAGFEGGGMENVTIVGGVANAVAVKVHRSNTRFTHFGVEGFTGAVGIELDDDPDGVSAGNPFDTHIVDLYIRCWTGAASTLQYGVRAKNNFNASSIRRFQIAGCSVAGIAIEHAVTYTLADGNVETNISGTDAAVGILIGGAAGTPVGGAIRDVYGERNDGCNVKVQRCRGLIIENLYSDGLTGAVSGDNQYSIQIVDASGNSSNVQRVTIIGGDMSRAAVADVLIDGTRSVEFKARPKLLSEGTLGAAWATATAYAVGDLRSRNSLNYTAMVAHVSAADTEPGVGANWATVWRRSPRPIAIANNGGFVKDYPLSTGSIVNNGVFSFSEADIGLNHGMLTIKSNDEAEPAVTFFLRGGSGQADEYLDPTAIASAAQGTANSINVYYSGGYKIENRRGGARTFVLYWQPNETVP